MAVLDFLVALDINRFWCHAIDWISESCFALTWHRHGEPLGSGNCLDHLAFFLDADLGYFAVVGTNLVPEDEVFVANWQG